MFQFRPKSVSRDSTGTAIIGAFIAALLMKFFLLDFVVVDGFSMDPAIRSGTIVVVCKVFYGFKLPGSGRYIFKWKDVQTGDIVVFYTPLGEIAVKRCGQIWSGSFFALGDNNSQSYDSRNYGPVPDENIIGRVLGIK